VGEAQVWVEAAFKMCVCVCVLGGGVMWGRGMIGQLLATSQAAYVDNHSQQQCRQDVRETGTRCDGKHADTAVSGLACRTNQEMLLSPLTGKSRLQLLLLLSTGQPAIICPVL